IDNRRVLAVKAMYRKRVKGALMGTSKTGSIVFIEPETTLNLSRELHNLLFEEKEEVKRILKALTEFVRPYKNFLTDCQSYLIAVDIIAAKAKYALLINATLPLIIEEKSSI